MKAVSLLLTAILIACCCLSCKKTTQPEELVTLTISPESGGYSPQQAIGISCNYSDANICYTTDGSEPTQNSSRYVQPLSLESVINAQSNFAMLKVKAFKAGYLSSETNCLEYHIDFGYKISTPVISPDDGAYDSGSLITISCNQPEA
ncbi:MAG: chitobiase/beta-hexosaminidase C-terminal domain-containing protein, partial [Candidatus Cloacimonetes bacterium]|nr:chitobiase/beta-hexosaminidase C-terminal domain-containing protein [Candidatus Cloacimonadota bacterium]